MLISHDHKFIFIHIGKTGGTSIEQVLCEHLDIDLKCTEKAPDGEWWKHIWAKGMRRRVGEKLWNKYFTFAFVRNPFDMILSLYSMYTQYPEYTNLSIHPSLYHPWNQYSDFSNFVLSMGEEKYDPNKKWRRQLRKLGAKDQKQVWESLRNLQTSYLTESWMGREGPGTILVDFVGRFENLGSDFHKVCDHVGLPRLDLIKYGATRHVPYYELYDSKMEEIVGNHFCIDIEQFGYSLNCSSSGRRLKNPR